MRHIGLALLAIGLLSGAGLAQTPPPPTAASDNPAEPNRIAAGGGDGLSCFSIMAKWKETLQVSCYATGALSRFGDVTAKTATCNDANFNEVAKQCFEGFTVKSSYYGAEGPVCAAILFDVRPSGDKPPNQMMRRVHSKEVFPCEGQPAPAASALDKGEAAEFLWKRTIEQSSRTACVFKDKKVASLRGGCVARGSPGPDGKITVGAMATCSDPALADFAVSCLKSLRLNKASKDSPPAEVCVRIDHTGKELIEDAKDPRTSVGELQGCPAGFFQ